MDDEQNVAQFFLYFSSGIVSLPAGLNEETENQARTSTGSISKSPADNIPTC